jgi:hypothetical protein
MEARSGRPGRATTRRMGISGNLKTMSPGDLLQWLSMAEKTGTLVISALGIEKKVFFREGRIISSASNDPREYLCQFLMSHGYIDEGQVKRAMEEQARTRVLIGMVLVNMGAVEEKNLAHLMRRKAEESIYDIFLWKEGEFSFIDGELPDMEMIPLRIDVTGLLMEGSRRVDEWNRIRRVIPDKYAIPVVERSIEMESLPEVPRRILSAINGHRSIEELVLESRSSHFIVSRTVYELVESGHARILPDGKKVAGPTPSAEVRALRTETEEVQGLLNHAQEALRSGDYEKGLRMITAAQNVDPNNGRVVVALKGAKNVIAGALEREGIVAKKVPKLVKSFEEISGMNFSSNEGFMLSRVNGVWDLGSIIKISPLRELDSMLIFRKLKQDGIIELE